MLGKHDFSYLRFQTALRGQRQSTFLSIGPGTETPLTLTRAQHAAPAVLGSPFSSFLPAGPLPRPAHAQQFWPTE